MTIRRLIPVSIGIIAAVAVVAGFAIIGSPEHQRRIALDRATIDELKFVAAAQRQPPRQYRSSVARAMIRRLLDRFTRA